MSEERPAETLKICLLQPRRIRSSGSRELRVFETGEIAEVDRLLAMRLIGSGLADGVDADTKVSSGTSTDVAAAPKKARASKSSSKSSSAAG